MSESESCGVCLVVRKGMNRVGGLDVCDVCFHGGAGEAVRQRGWSLDSTLRTVRTKNETMYFCDVVGVMEAAGTLQANFRMKTGIWSLIGMFSGISADDPLFNKLVYATGSNGVKEFLESEGAQSAVMDLVGEPAKMSINGGHIKVSAFSRSECPNQARLESEVAVLMAHIEVFNATN